MLISIMAEPINCYPKMSLQTVIEILGTRKLFGDRIRKIGYDLHDALTDNANWDAKYWELDATRAAPVKGRIKKEYLESPEGIAFGALWAGETPEREIEESIESLLLRFDEGRIGTREIYIIRKKTG
jgi:hypothetical protein